MDGTEVSVDVIDGSSIGPRFGGRGLRNMSSSSSTHSNHSSCNYNEAELTLLPNQTYPEYPDFGGGVTFNELNASRSTNGSSRMETPLNADSSVYHSNRLAHNVSMTSMISTTSSILSKKKERDWYETSLDSPLAARKLKAAPPPPPTPPPAMTVRAQPVHISDGDDDDDDAAAASAEEEEAADQVEEVFDIESVVAFESPKNLELISAGKWEPYREVSKPFETSDIYKYSAKYQRGQQAAISTTKAHYTPLQPLMACHPLNGRHSAASASSSVDNDNNPAASNNDIHRSKPATLV